jgi:hypothetical protein
MGATDAIPTPALLTVAILDMQTAYTDAMSKSIIIALRRSFILITPFSGRPTPDFVDLKAGETTTYFLSQIVKQCSSRCNWRLNSCTRTLQVDDWSDDLYEYHTRWRRL